MPKLMVDAWRIYMPVITWFSESVGNRGQPADTVKVGNFVVPIYSTPSKKGGREYPGFTARFRDASGPQRIFRSSLEDLRAEVTKRVTPLATGQSDCLVLRGPERAIYERAKLEAMALGVELDEAVVQLRRINERGRQLGCTIQQALEFWSRHHDHSKCATPVPQVVEAFLSDRKALGNSAEDIADLGHRLRRFAVAFRRPLRDITKDEYRDYFQSLTGGLRDRKNHRSAVRRLLNWAKDADYLAHEHPGMPRTTSRVKIPPKRVQVFERAERELMFDQARPHELPASLIAAYAPLRSKEVGRISWEDIDWQTGHLMVFADGAKKRESRRIYLVPELLARLAPHRQSSGRIYPHKNFDRVGPRLARRAGINWPRNGWRCSVISHMQAFVRDLGRVADEAGNSPREIKRSYLKPLPAEVGRAWFGLAERDRHPLEPARQYAEGCGQQELVAAKTDVLAPNVIVLPLVANRH